MPLSPHVHLSRIVSVNVLICVDHSSASTKAVKFASDILSGCRIANLNATLFHVAELLPEYVLSDKPSVGQTPRSLGEAWGERAKSAGQQLLDSQAGVLQTAGVPAAQIHKKLATMNCLPEAKKVAAALALIEEIQQGNYDVVCIGRRGASQMSSSIIGGVAEKVIRECAGKTIWLVD